VTRPGARAGQQSRVSGGGHLNVPHRQLGISGEVHGQALKQGRFDPALPLAFRLARVFDCPIEDLFTPEDWHPEM